MNSALWFILGILLLTVSVHLLVFRSISGIVQFWKDKSKAKHHKGIITFLVVFIAVGLLVAASTVKGDDTEFEMFAFGEAYVGVDYTTMASPFCYNDGINDRVTSHGGFRANIIQTKDQITSFNVKYTHHSCAFNADKERYDSAGAELVIRLW